MPTAVSPLTVVEIPLEKILPNPDNPAGPVYPEDAETMSESLKEEGQKTEIRVRELAPEEKQAHPGFEYSLIGGHVRLEGAKLAGWSTLKALVLEKTNFHQELKDAFLDNRKRKVGWWLDDLAIEKMLMPTNGDGQRKLAAQLGIYTTKVNNAWKVTRVLNPAARALVSKSVRPTNTKNKAFSLTESILVILADLGDSALVEKALSRVLNDQMTESQVKALVASMKAGTPAEAYVPASPKPKAPRTAQIEKPEIATSPTGPIGPSPRNDSSKSAQTPVGTQIGAAVSGHLLWKQVAQASGQILNRVFPRFMRVFHWISGGFQKAGVKNPFWANVLTTFLVLWVGSFLIHQATRLVGRVLMDINQSRYMEKTESPVVALVTALPAKAPALVTASTHKAHLSTGPQAGGQALVVPSPGAEGNGGTKGDSAKTIPAWAQEVTPAAGDFANHFYGISYSNWADTLTFLKNQMVGNNVQTMVDQYFPPSLQKDMQTRMLAEYFSTKGTKVLSGEGDTAEVLVQGTVTTMTRAGRTAQTVSTKPVALLMTFRHSEGFGSKIEKVTEVDPATVATKSPSADLGKQLGDGVHDVSDAVNKADAASSTVDKAKNLLGF